jgi:hypothetical protein
MHDAGQSHQRRVAAELEVVDEDLEGALVVAMDEFGAGRVEGVGAVAFGTARTCPAGT